jgi:hypothetical protein
VIVNVRFQVLTMGSVEMTVIWDVLCSEVEIDQVLIMEVVSNSETSVSFYQTYTEQYPRRQAIVRLTHSIFFRHHH